MTSEEFAAWQDARAREVTVTIDAKDRKLSLRAIARQVMLLLASSELLYSKALTAIMREFHAAYLASLEKFGLHAYDPRVAAVELHYLLQLPGVTGRAFDRVAPALLRANRDMAKYTLRGISSSEQGLADVLAQAKERSIQLVEKAGRAYAADVRAVLSDPENASLGAAGIKRLLLERGNVSVSRADLIGRDQVLKTSAAMNEARQRRAGVEQYEWSGVMDERERPEHVALEGRVFRWDEETPIGYRPGEDYQCRCIAVAWVEG